MQKLKKSFALLLGISLFSCGSIPRKPKVEICGHNAPSGLAECYDNQTQEFRSIPIENTDKYIMFSSDDWGLILLYVSILERRFRSMGNGVKYNRLNDSTYTEASDELKKIIDTSNLHN